MDSFQSEIDGLIKQAESLMQSIPKRAELSRQKKAIINNYKPNGFDRLLPALGGSGSIASRIIRSGKEKSRNDAIEVVEQQFNHRIALSEQQYTQWFGIALNAITSTGINSGINKMRDSKYKSKLDSRYVAGIAALRHTNCALDRQVKQPPLLIKAGQPLQGRDYIRQFIETSRTQIKIQEPYPSLELLRMIESAKMDVEVSLLIGPLKSEEKKRFIEELALLRKSGRNIIVLSVHAHNVAPFHDRFILSSTECISSGTSFTGIGMRDSILQKITEWQDISTRFDEYFTQSTTIHKNQNCIREVL